MEGIDKIKYLQRINFFDRADVDNATLKSLHHHHLMQANGSGLLLCEKHHLHVSHRVGKGYLFNDKLIRKTFGERTEISVLSDIDLRVQLRRNFNLGIH